MISYTCRVSSGKESVCQCRTCKFVLWVRKMTPLPGPRRRKWQPTPVFLPGESRGQRSLAGYSPDKSRTWLKQLSTHAHTHDEVWGMSFRKSDEEKELRFPEGQFCTRHPAWCTDPLSQKGDCFGIQQINPINKLTVWTSKIYQESPVEKLFVQ